MFFFVYYHSAVPTSYIWQEVIVYNDYYLSISPYTEKQDSEIIYYLTVFRDDASILDQIFKVRSDFKKKIFYSYKKYSKCI